MTNQAMLESGRRVGKSHAAVAGCYDALMAGESITIIAVDRKTAVEFTNRMMNAIPDHLRVDLDIKAVDDNQLILRVKDA